MCTLVAAVLLIEGCHQKVDDAAVAAIIVSPDSGTIGTAATLPLSARAIDGYGNLVADVTFTWRSSAPQIADVDADGSVIGGAPGNTLITAFAAGVTSNTVSLTVVPRSGVRGTVASGEPWAAASVVLKDSAGRVAVAVTSTDGRFFVDTTTLRPPFFLRATSSDGETTLYGVGGAANTDSTINVTTLTDLIVDSWYRLQGESSAAAFENPSEQPPPPALTSSLIANVYIGAIQYWLDRAGIDAATFDPVATPFAADGTGIDYVLDLLTIDEPREHLTLAAGSVSEEATVSFDPANGVLGMTAAVRGANGMSGGTYHALVPLSAQRQAAAQAIDAQVSALAATISARGGGLVANDVLPYLSVSLMHDGLSEQQYAAAMVTADRGKQLSCRLNRIEALQDSPPSADVVAACSVLSAAGAPQIENRRYRFVRSDGTWLVNGNQRVADIGVHTEVQNFQGAVGFGSALRIVTSAVAPTGSVVAGSVYGSGLGEAGSALQQRNARDLELEPEPQNLITIGRERFFASLLVQTDVPSQLAYDVALTSAAGETLTYTVESGDFTTEAVAISNMAGNTLAEARLDQPLLVQWTLPETMVVVNVQLQALAYVGAADAARPPDCVTAGPLLPAGAVSSTITIPSTCHGLAVSRVDLLVTVNGAGGTRSLAVYSFRPPADPVAFVPAVMDLPVMRIVTENGAPIVSEDDYLHGTITIDANGSGTASYAGPMQIRGRGNSTWAMPKKPYKVKLDSKSALLGMPSSKDWVLLANYADKTLLRNEVAFELGKRFGMAWTPRSRFVELFLNGEYEGTYQLTESIKVDKDRVNIDELKSGDTVGEALTGGYLLEVDARLDGDSYFVTDNGVPIVIDTPDPPEDQQFWYIEGYVQNAEDALYSRAFADPQLGYPAYLDVDSFIDWYLVNELFKNNDAIFFSSCWMYKARNGKLFMGPLWDFDIGAGNVDYNGNDDPTGWWVRDGAWFAQMFSDPVFAERVKTRWNVIKVEKIDSILEHIDQNAAALRQASLNNFQRWPILAEYVWPNPVVTGSYTGEVQYLRTWLQTRIAWMDAQFNSP